MRTPWRLVLCSTLLLLCGSATGCNHRLPSPFRPSAKRTLPGVILQPIRLFVEQFDRIDPKRWKEVEVKDKTQYAVEEVDGGRALKAESHGGRASILLAPVRVTPEPDVWLSWRWRVERPSTAEDLTTRRGSDAAARVYVYYDTRGLPWQKRSVDYVWSSKLPEGTVLASPFSKKAQIIVAESGKRVGQWRSARRNLREDYLRCFGEEPPDVVAIGLMTDTDNTGGDAAAYYDDVAITREPSTAAGRTP